MGKGWFNPQALVLLSNDCMFYECRPTLRTQDTLVVGLTCIGILVMAEIIDRIVSGCFLGIWNYRVVTVSTFEAWLMVSCARNDLSTPLHFLIYRNDHYPLHVLVWRFI
jgi:hypothetical protein